MSDYSEDLEFYCEKSEDHTCGRQYLDNKSFKLEMSLISMDANDLWRKLYETTQTVVQLSKECDKRRLFTESEVLIEVYARLLRLWSIEMSR